MRLEDLADRIDSAGDVLAGASTTMNLVDPGARAFGADAAGRLGELGRALHRQFTSALTARGRESAAHGARLADTAQALRLVASGYRGVDEEAVSDWRARPPQNPLGPSPAPRAHDQGAS